MHGLEEIYSVYTTHTFGAGSGLCSVFDSHLHRSSSLVGLKNSGIKKEIYGGRGMSLARSRFESGNDMFEGNP